MLNKVHLIGRLGKDPEFRTTPSGIAVATFSLATDEKRKNDNGETTSKTEWHKIVAFRRQAEVARDYLRKALIGRAVRFKVDYRVEKIGRSFGTLWLVGDGPDAAVSVNMKVRPATTNCKGRHA